MASIRKNERLVCVPCGREVVVSEAGISSEVIWCCGTAMKKADAAVKKTPAAKKLKSKPAPKKTAKK